MTETTSDIPRDGTRSARARWRIALVLLALAVVAVVLFDGSRRIPTGAAEGTALNVPPAPAPMSATTQPTLRIATFNIHGGAGSDDRKDLARTAQGINGFDIVGLQEVHGSLFGSPQNDVQALGEQLKLPWLFAPSERRWWHDDFGNGLLCRLPVESWLRVPMPGTQSRGHRNVLIVRVPWNQRMLTFLIAHVDREDDHDAQIRFLMHLFMAVNEPAVLMGDLNTSPGDRLMLPLLNGTGIVDALANAGTTTQQSSPRVDWILLRGLSVNGSGTDDRGASDHPLYFAEVRLP